MVVDILVGAVLLISAIVSFIRGFVRELLTIFGVVGGLLMAYFFGGRASNIVEGWITPETSDFALEDTSQKLFDVIPYPLAADILAYGAVFIVVVGALSVISHFLSESLKKIGLGAVDRSLGVVFGLVRGVLVLGLLYLPVFMLVDADTKDGWFEGSHSHVYLEKTSGFIAKFLPGQSEEIAEEGGKKIDAAKETRDILKELKVLKKDEGLVFEGKEDAAKAKTQPNDAAAGYDENFRDEMDKLFQDETAAPLNP